MSWRRSAVKVLQLVKTKDDIMDLCKGKEDPRPVYGELEDSKVNVIDLLN